MDKGESAVTKLVLNLIDDKIEDINLFIEETKDKEINNIPKDKIDTFFQQGFNKVRLSKTDYLILRNYTGYNFKGINSILRDKWTYEYNGILNDEKKYRYRENAENISELINKFPKTKESFKVYRGVTIDAFKDYGIDNLNDLVYLKDRFIYERGFTSTSLIRDTSYFDKEIEGKLYNIELEIVVTENSQDGMPLIGYKLSFSSEQNEYVFDRGALIRIIDVDIRDNYAYLKGILIPKKIYEENKEKGKRR